MISIEALRRALQQSQPHRNQPPQQNVITGESPGKPAAVLIPLLLTDGGGEILYTKRPDAISNHPGQVSFPGGRVEPDDRDVIATALRETHEEVGVAAEHIEIVGVLPELGTITNFRVTPVVGVMRAKPELRLNESEVDAAFWMPFGKLVEPAGWRSLDVMRGEHHRIWFFDDAPHLIWGATAQITRDFLAQLGYLQEQK